MPVGHFWYWIAADFGYKSFRRLKRAYAIAYALSAIAVANVGLDSADRWRDGLYFTGRSVRGRLDGPNAYIF
jgi:hypothetical protein